MVSECGYLLIDAITISQAWIESYHNPVGAAVFLHKKLGENKNPPSLHVYHDIDKHGSKQENVVFLRPTPISTPIPLNVLQNPEL